MEQKIKKLIEYNQRFNEFVESDTYSFYRFLNQNRLIISVLKGNFYDLFNLYQQHNSQGINDRLWDRTNAKYRHKFQKEITRCISNYLSSLYSTIDYSRKYVSTFLQKNPAVFSYFQEQKKAFVSNVTSHKFIQDLRNYSMHDSVIIITSEYSRNSEWLADRKDIYIKKEDVTKWSGWSSDACQFIELQTEKIYIMKILDNHFKEFIELQNTAYLLLLAVDEERTSRFRSEIAKFYDDSFEFAKGYLLYTEGYIRYIDKLLVKAHRTTTSYTK